MTKRHVRTMAWLALTGALVATGCNAALRLDDYSIADEGECLEPTGCSGAAGSSGGSAGTGGASGSTTTAVCGNGVCQGSESCDSCPADCGTCSSCGHSECTTGTALADTCTSCSATICTQHRPSCCSGAWDASCVDLAAQLCPEVCGSQPLCGDGSCQTTGGETCVNCPADCGVCGASCGDGSCQPSAGETCSNCPGDCGSCSCTHSTCATGDAMDAACSQCTQIVCPLRPSCCEQQWDSACVQLATANCAGGCGQGTCGDGKCNYPQENCSSCSPDCGGCGACAHSGCTAGASLSTSCSEATGQVCAARPSCCTSAWDATCVQLFQSQSGLCNACGDGICGPAESCTSCPADCQPCEGCAHDECAEGSALATSCNTCAAEVCKYRPSCCGTSWDSACVKLAADLCPSGCGAACGDGVCGKNECNSCQPDCVSCLISDECFRVATCDVDTFQQCLKNSPNFSGNCVYQLNQATACDKVKAVYTSPDCQSP